RSRTAHRDTIRLPGSLWDAGNTYGRSSHALPRMERGPGRPLGFWVRSKEWPPFIDAPSAQTPIPYPAGAGPNGPGNFSTTNAHCRRPLRHAFCFINVVTEKGATGLVTFQPILNLFAETGQNNPRFLELCTRHPGRLPPGCTPAPCGLDCAF